MSGSVIVAGARTPIGRLSSAFATLGPVALGAAAVREALRRAGVAPEQVAYVFMGQVLQAGQGQNPARQAAVAAGIPMDVPATTVNSVCLSGLQAVHLADLLIQSGEADLVVAGGMESMTAAPYLLAGARAGLRFGEAPLGDAIMTDGLSCAFTHLAMGAATEADAAVLGISRERQDEIAARSHARAAAASGAGRFSAEIVPVALSSGGSETLVSADEGIRTDSTPERLARLRPAFSAEGTITAGNASQISDGAAALVLASPRRAEALGVRPLAELVSYGQVAGPDASLLTQPARAISAALARAELTVSDLELVEINEAFAAVAAASIDALSLPDDIVNVNGGAIALGHPIGMTGARLVLSLAYELARRGASLGAAALCGGGGQGDAAILRVLG